MPTPSSPSTPQRRPADGRAPGRVPDTGVEGGPADVALDYVRANLAAFGLTGTDLDDLVLVRRVTSVDGLQRLFWQQRAHGVPALGSGLRANVTADGRLINIAGSPVSGISGTPVAARLTAGQARVAALAVRGWRRYPRSRVPAGRPLHHDIRGRRQRRTRRPRRCAQRPRWETTVKVDGSHTYRVVVDAASGRTLLRRNLVQSAAASASTGTTRAHPGGTRSLVQIPPEWVTSTTALTGPNVHAFADVNDNDVADAGEETPPSTPPDIWSYGLTTFPDNIGGGPTGACTADFPCTWDPGTTSPPRR